MFLPMTKKEMDSLGWKALDVILITGDAYIDSPFSGVALVGKSLLNAGYKVGVISQPDISTGADILRLGLPELFWGVTSGTTDSLVANYTAVGKKRRSCDFTAGGVNDRRPDRAVIAYANLIRQHDKTKKPIILGGIEASLRRVAHYDMLSDKVRRPILFDAKADYLVYGLGEYTVINIANAIKNGKSSDILSLRGVCYISKEIPANAHVLPSYEDTAVDKSIFNQFFKKFHHSASTVSDEILVQKCGDRYAVQNPPFIMSTEQLDNVHSLQFERTTHPFERGKGEVKAEHITKQSIPTHRGCYGECNFCAISVHQGRIVVSRSEKSIVNEVKTLARDSKFNGNVSDLGGPTANMYGSECVQMKSGTPCKHKKCLYPSVCPSLERSQYRYLKLLQTVREMPEVKRVFVASGIRCDLALGDKTNGGDLVDAIAMHHTSGQIKLAPEHSEKKVLDIMGKTDVSSVTYFAKRFMEISKKVGKPQFVTYYFMAAHPGCTETDMKSLEKYVGQNIGFQPEQVQIFTPTPSTISTCIYYTEVDFDGKKIYVAKGVKEKTDQKETIVGKQPYTSKRSGRSK